MIPRLYSQAVLPDPLDLFGQLLAQAPFAVWVADKEGKVVLFNEALKELIGIEDPEKILDSYNIFNDPIATAQGLIPYIKRVLKGEVVQTVVMMDTGANHFSSGPHEPRVFYVRNLYFPLTDPSGNFEYVVMLVENITQQYLEDLTLTKMAHDVEHANSEMVEREKTMIRLKEKLAGLKAQHDSLQRGMKGL